MNVLTLVPTINDRYFGQPIKYLDIHVDGKSLRQFFAGRLGALPEQISPLGWCVPEAEERIVEDFERFLFKTDADLPDERYSVLVCPLDGDVGCGAYSARFTRQESQVIWNGFGYENDYDPESRDLETFSHLLPLTFEWQQYEQALLQGLSATLVCLKKQRPNVKEEGNQLESNAGFYKRIRRMFTT